MFGTTLRKIREDKNLKPKDAAHKIMSLSQLKRIEEEGQVPSIDKFISLLNRLNVEYDEFFQFSDDKYFNLRTVMRNQTTDTLRQRNPQKTQSLLDKLDRYYREYNDPHFLHLWSNASAIKARHEHADPEKVKAFLKPVTDYLDSVDNWCYYEMVLFNNTFFYYDYDTAKALGNEAIKNIQKNYQDFRDEGILRGLLGNLAFLAVEHKKWKDALGYIRLALEISPSTKELYPQLLTKVVGQVVCFHTDRNSFDPAEITAVITYFRLMNMEDVVGMLENFVKRHLPDGF